MEVLSIESVGERFDKIVQLIGRFCDTFLDDEYKNLAYNLLRDVRKIRIGILSEGQLNIWAASVMYAVVKINYLNDKSFKPYIPFSLIFEFFGVRKTTIESKVHQLQKYLEFTPGDKRYATSTARNIKKYKYDLIKSKIRKFCNEKLNEEYKILGYKLLDSLYELDDIPFLRGSLDVWAGSIMYTLSQINLLYDKSSEPYMPQEDIRSYFDVKSSTIIKRTSEIKKLLSLEVGEYEFSVEFAREKLSESDFDISSMCMISVTDANPVIEALGCGMQSILVRKSHPPSEKFILFPSTFQESFEKSARFFKNKQYEFVKDNYHPKMEGEYSEVKYYAEVVDVIENPPGGISDFRSFQLYTSLYFDKYLNDDNCVIWILRVYKLPNSMFLLRQENSVHLMRGVNLEGEPVLDNLNFFKLKAEIMDTKWEAEKRHHIKEIKDGKTLKTIDDKLY